MTGNETTATKQKSRTQFNKKELELAVAGGVAFWATNFLISLTPIAAEYRSALSISYLPMVLVESLLGGLVIGLLVGYFLLRFFEMIPAKNPILKSLILSFATLLIIETFTTLVNINNLSVYFLIGAGINVPRFLALGIVIGYLYDRCGGTASTIPRKSRQE
jgi:F0F1-type ATP synthase assembly protein I